MFMNPRHISNDMESNDDGKNEHFKGDDGIMEFNHGLGSSVKQLKDWHETMFNHINACIK